MKYVKILLLSILLMLPMEALAYSDYIIPGGESIGISIHSDGILIVGFYKTNGKVQKGSPELKIGDKITEVAGIPVNTINDLVSTIEDKMQDNKVELTYVRNGVKGHSTIELTYEDNTYKTGLYVKDAITGIGTLTYIDPETKNFGALGHEIVESNTNRLVEVKSGEIFRSIVTSVDRSMNGSPGGKNAKFYSGTVFGYVNKNTNKGIYGKYTSELLDKKKLKVASIDEIEKGKAQIYTVLKDESIGTYEINITKIDKNSDIKNIYFEVIDKELLDKTGGIVQGMSGSPIIQNDKIIGAVTHVVVSNPTNGYGISIVKMLEEGEN